MNYILADALLILALAAKLHRKNKAVRKAARDIKKDCSPFAKIFVKDIIAAKEPLEIIKETLENLPKP